MSRLHARVLLDTGPSEDETDLIRGLFARVGLTAEAEGHSYGGPPPSSAFLIVINVPLAAFLTGFLGREHGGGRALRELLCALAELRADPGLWGRPHRLKLEDATSSVGVLIPLEIPMRALAALLGLDLARFDRGSPPVTVLWSAALQCWQAEVLTGARLVLRRPPMRRHGAKPAVSVRQLSAVEHGELGRLADDGAGSVIRWQRAQIVLLNSLGWSTAVISARTLLPERRVSDVIENFNDDGFTSLEYEYAGGRQPEPAPDEEREARAIAGAPPAWAGLSRPSWDDALLAEFLVSQGIAGDVSPGWLAALRTDGARSPAGGSPRAAYQHIPG